MMKFIVVDDEPLARECFTELLDWQSHGFELAGCAANGAQAMKLVQETMPDLVITDISMPVMDGLALCSQLHQEYPKIRIVILTAYKDFEYARKAISYGVNEYLLKNQVEASVVLPLMQRLAVEIEAQRRKEAVHQQHMYQSVMLNMTPEVENRESFGGKQALCVLVKKQTPYLLEQLGDYMPSEIPLEQKEVERLLAQCGPLALHQMVWVDAKRWGLTLVHKEQDEFDFFRMGAYIRTFKEKLEALCLSKYGARTFILFAVSSIDPKRVKESMDGMRTYSKFSVFYEKSPLVPYQQIQPKCIKTPAKGEQIQPLLDRVYQAVVYAKKDDVRTYLQEIKELYTSPAWDLGQFSHAVRQLLELREKLMEKSGLATVEADYQKFALQVERLVLAEECFEFLQDEYLSLTALFSPVGVKLELSNKKIIQAVEYIHKNYARHLTAKSVGESVMLSEVYFSNLFKKETGITFGDYLTAYRMNVARYLIANGDYKIYEIAKLTGYSTPQYFSQVFMRTMGCTPLEYKTYGQEKE